MNRIKALQEAVMSLWNKLVHSIPFSWRRSFVHWVNRLLNGRHKTDGDMPTPTNECRVVPRPSILPGNVAYECGHEYFREFAVDLYGEVRELKNEFFAKRPWCGDCLLQKCTEGTIRCALCGFAIESGDGVAVYFDDGRFRKAWKTMHGDHVIGCLRTACCPSGGFFAGRWDGERIISPFASGSAAAEAMATGQAVIVNLE